MAERRPLVIIGGQIQQLPAGDSTPGSGAGGGTGYTPDRVRAGYPATVPEFQQWVVYANPLIVEDDLTLEGDLVLLL